MNSSTYLQVPSKRKLWSVASVVFLHAMLLWAVMVGLHRTVALKLPAVVQATLIDEKRPEPPTPPQPQQTVSKPTPVAPASNVQPQSAEIPVAMAPSKESATVMSSPMPPNLAPIPPTPASTPTQTPVTTPPARSVAGVNMAQCNKPEYPVSSKRLEEEGAVTLRFLVGMDGKVIQSDIEKSSGYKRLDDAARNGLSKCLFSPATVDGKPEQAWTTIRYVWRLE